MKIKVALLTCSMLFPLSNFMMQKTTGKAFLLFLQCSKDIKKEWFTRNWQNPLIKEDNALKNHTSFGYYGTHQDGSRCFHLWDAIDAQQKFEKLIGANMKQNNQHLQNCWLSKKSLAAGVQLTLPDRLGTADVCTGDPNKGIYIFKRISNQEDRWWVLFTDPIKC